MTVETNPEELTLDPRVRRTRQWVRAALVDLLQEKPFAEISVTDLSKRAGIARVTFYQHFDSKEAVLLDLVADFFAQFYAGVDLAALMAFVEAGEVDAGVPLQAAPEVSPDQLALVRVALGEVTTAVRQLAIASFLQALEQSGIALDPTEAQLLATYHVAGMLGLLERQLNGELGVSTAVFQAATLRYLRNALRDVGGRP